MTISERPSTAPERAAPAPTPERAAPAPTPERAAPEQAPEEAAPRPARPVALITGVGRSIGIGAGIARQLAASGWDVAFTYWTPYDRRME